MIHARLARFGAAILTLVADAKSRSFVVPYVDEGTSAARQRELEKQLAAANSEIELLRARLEEANRTPASFAQMRSAELAIVRQRRLWIARGGARQT